MKRSFRIFFQVSGFACLLFLYSRLVKAFETRIVSCADWDGSSQDVQNQTEIGEETKAESPRSSVGADAYRKQDQI